MFDLLLMQMEASQNIKVDRTAIDDKVIISTIGNQDTDNNFETAVSHIEFGNGEWIVVEEYLTIEEAKRGHIKWKEKMEGDNLPDFLQEVSTSHRIKGTETENKIYLRKEE